MMIDVMTANDAEAGLRSRRRFVGLVMLWLLMVGGGVVVLGAQSQGLGCDSPSSDARFDSTVGTAHLRWWPVGVECVYTRAENGVDRRNEPGRFRVPGRCSALRSASRSSAPSARRGGTRTLLRRAST